MTISSNLNLRRVETRRRHHRFDTPSFAVEMNGYKGHTRNWSLGGAAVSFDDAVEMPVGGETTIVMHYGDGERQGSFDARLIRLDGGRTAAYQFTRMSDDGVDMMASAFKDLTAASRRTLSNRWETTRRYGDERPS